MHNVMNVSIVSQPGDALASAASVANVVVAFLALLVATISIFFTIRGLALQRKHNHLSVVPVPFIALADFENHIRVQIRNDGIGPLLIRKISFLVESAAGEHSDLVKYMPALPSGHYWTNYASGDARSIRPGDALVLLELKIDHTEKKLADFRDLCRKTLSKMTICLEYTDVYRNQFPQVSRKLDWFNQRLAPSKA